MTLGEIEDAAYDRGLEQGLENAKLESAKRALAMGLTIDQIANITQLSHEEIEKLQKAENNNPE